MNKVYRVARILHRENLFTEKMFFPGLVRLSITWPESIVNCKLSTYIVDKKSPGFDLI